MFTFTIKIPKGFFPQQDTGRLQGAVMGEQHISYQSLVEKAKWFEEQVRDGSGCRNRDHGRRHQRRRLAAGTPRRSTFNSSRSGFASRLPTR